MSAGLLAALATGVIATVGRSVNQTTAFEADAILRRLDANDDLRAVVLQALAAHSASTLAGRLLAEGRHLRGCV